MLLQARNNWPDDGEREQEQYEKFTAGPHPPSRVTPNLMTDTTYLINKTSISALNTICLRVGAGHPTDHPERKLPKTKTPQRPRLSSGLLGG